MKSVEPMPAAGAPRMIRARNISINSENAIHNDQGARALGYAGGLVSGVTVYAYLTRPVVDGLGEAWLGRNASRVVFLKPVYDGDGLRIAAEPGDGPTALRVRARNAAGEEVALLETEIPSAMEPPDLLDRQPPAPEREPRPPFSWDAVQVGQPFRALRAPSERAGHREWCASVLDEGPPYLASGRPPLHPSWILQQANNAVKHQFVMPPWIHVSSRILTRRLLRVGDPIEVRTVPVEKWEKQGHRYALLHVAILNEGEPALEIRHKVILQVAPQA